MITPGSRYEDAEHVFTQSHVYSRFGYPYLQTDSPNLKVVIANRETTYRLVSTPLGPTQNQEYYVKEGESMQFLAFKFFADAKRWSEIADANPGLWYPLDAGMGDYIQVPPVS